MAYRIPTQTVITMRDKHRVVVPPGRPYDFTAEEIEHLTASGSIRKIRDESKMIPLPAGPGDGNPLIAAKTADDAADL